MTEAPCSEITPAIVNVSVLIKNGMFWALDKVNPSYFFFYFFFNVFALFAPDSGPILLLFFLWDFLFLFFMGMFHFATWVIIFTIILLFIFS